MTKIAIIGTAGRDKTKPMTRELWQWMLDDAKQRVPRDAHLVSGGAAWADHLAVELFLTNHVGELTLHLPAPFEHRFIGPGHSSASAANYYHTMFSKVIGVDTLMALDAAVKREGIDGTFEPAAPGYAAMFARNAKVARAESMLAYTFGTGDEPADGGTKNTWDQCRGKRVHVPLPTLR